MIYPARSDAARAMDRAGLVGRVGRIGDGVLALDARLDVAPEVQRPHRHRRADGATHQFCSARGSEAPALLLALHLAFLTGKADGDEGASRAEAFAQLRRQHLPDHVGVLAGEALEKIAIDHVSTLPLTIRSLLFTLGATFLVGGLRHHVQEFNRSNARLQAGLLFLATVALLVPSALSASDSGATAAITQPMVIEAISGTTEKAVMASAANRTILASGYLLSPAARALRS